MKNKVINYIINEKDNLCMELDDIIYPDITHTYEPLTFIELEKIEELRKQILDCYALIDILNFKGEDK